MATLISNSNIYTDYSNSSSRTPTCFHYGKSEPLDNSIIGWSYNHSQNRLHDSETIKKHSIPNHTSTSNSRIDVQHISKFDKLYAQYSELPSFQGINPIFARNSFIKVLSQLLQLNFDRFSSELTYDASALFTLKKDDYTFYFEQFLDEEEQDSELALTVFNCKTLLYNSTGSLPQLIREINYKSYNIFQENVVLNPHELPY